MIFGLPLAQVLCRRSLLRCHAPCEHTALETGCAAGVGRPAALNGVVGRVAC